MELGEPVPPRWCGWPALGTEYEAKIAALAATIGHLAPDLLGVQEVGSLEALADLVIKLDGDWHTELADPDRRGIRVGLLSRLPLSEVAQTTGFLGGLHPVQVDDDGTVIATMSRPALRARVDVAGTRVDVVCCHLKSKLLTFPGGRFSTSDEDERARFAVYALGRRAAEAATVRGIATQLLNRQGQQRALLVLGDLNDTEHSATTTLLNGPGGSEIGTPGSDRLQIMDIRQRLDVQGLHAAQQRQWLKRLDARGATQHQVPKLGHTGNNAEVFIVPHLTRRGCSCV